VEVEALGLHAGLLLDREPEALPEQSFVRPLALELPLDLADPGPGEEHLGGSFVGFAFFDLVDGAAQGGFLAVAELHLPGQRGEAGVLRCLPLDLSPGSDCEAVGCHRRSPVLAGLSGGRCCRRAARRSAPAWGAGHPRGNWRRLPGCG